MESVAEGSRDEEFPPPVKRAPGARIPLSFEQERFWQLQVQGFGSACVVPFAWEMEGKLDVEAFKLGIADLLERHESLRTRLVEVDGVPCQVIDGSQSHTLEVKDVSFLEPAERAAAAKEILEAEGSREFVLSASLFRTLLIRMDDNTHLLFVAIHHGIWDGWSTGIIFRELGVLYQARLSGREHGIPALPLQYSDYTAWQREKLSPQRLQGLIGYWKERLRGIQALPIKTDHPAPLVPSLNGAGVSFVLPKEVSLRLVEYARVKGVTYYLVLLAAYQCLLAHMTGKLDVAIVSPFHGRTHPSLFGLIGSFVNKIVVRNFVSMDATFSEHLDASKAAFGAAYAHRELPYEILLSELRNGPGALRDPPFRVAFAFQNFPSGVSEFPSVSCSSVACGRISTQFDLTLNMFPPVGGEAFQGCLVFPTDLFHEETIKRLVDRLLRLIKVIVTNGDLPVRALFLDESKQLHFPERGTEVHSDNSGCKCIHELFVEQAHLRPAAVALSCDGQYYTYDELNRRSNQLSKCLSARGVGPDQLVGIYAERSADLVIGLLGILKAGGAYLPLDPGYPAERLAYIVTDAAPSLLLIQSRLACAWIPNTAEVIALDREWDESVSRYQHGQGMSGVVGPERLAYVIYTSGSTGYPKGVMITHRNVVRLFTVTSPVFRFDERDVWTMFHSFAFDFSVWELWGALMYGGRVVIVPYLTARSPQRFYDLVCQEGVTVLNQTPSAFSQFMRAQENEKAGHHSLREVIFGGEKLEPQTLLRWVNRHGSEQPQLVNMYGITETTVHVTHHRLSEQEVRAVGKSPVGRPISDMQVYILDTQGQPVSIGVKGELYVAGHGVARGYLNRPDLTSERFVPDPFSLDGGSRMYKTGDLGAWRPDGTIEYLGRNDSQVKIRGFRIELGEIEAQLHQIADVHEAVAIVCSDACGGKEIAAFVTCKAQGLTPEAIRKHLKRVLPSHMIPSTLRILEQFPLTPNGKVDRAALAVLPVIREDSDNVAQGSGSWETTPDANIPVERVFGAIWAEILRVRPISIEADFFDLGGSSWTAIAAASLMQEQSGMELSATDLIEKRTIRTIVASASSRLPWSHLVNFRTQGMGSPIYFIHSARGSASLYSVLAKAFDGIRPFYGIQAYGLLAGQKPLVDVTEIGRRYTRAIIESNQDGRFIVGGYCFGGYLANEVTWQLESMGCNVEATVMIDPEDIAVLQDNYAMVSDSRTRYTHDTKFLSWFSLVFDPRNQPICTSSELDAVQESNRIGYILRRAKAHNSDASSLREVDVLNMIELYFSARIAMQNFKPKLTRSNLIVIRCKRDGTVVDCGGWQRTTWGRAVLRECGDDHFSMMNETGQISIARIIQQCIVDLAEMPSGYVCEPVSSSAFLPVCR